MVRGLEHSTSWGREPGLGSLVERGHLPRACDCLKGSCRHERAKLAASDNAGRDNSHRLQLGRLTCKKKLLPQEGGVPWDMYPEGQGSPSSGV